MAGGTRTPSPYPIKASGDLKKVTAFTAGAGADHEAADPAAGAAGDSNPNGSKAKMRK